MRLLQKLHWFGLTKYRNFLISKGKRKKRVYVAVPYTGCTDFKMDEVFTVVNAVASLLLDKYIVFSPITHGHAIASSKKFKAGKTWKFWKEQCLPFIDMCDEVLVVCLPGWERSAGVAAEIHYASLRYKRIEFLHLKDKYINHILKDV